MADLAPVAVGTADGIATRRHGSEFDRWRRGQDGGGVVEVSAPLEPGIAAVRWPQDAARMGGPEPELPETRTRRCPSCASERITPVSHVTAIRGVIKVEYRCEVCGTGFWFLRDAIV